MSVDWRNDVAIKRRGQSDFLPIISKTRFGTGDSLRIGQESLARVYCIEKVCELGTGNYKTCCIEGCRVVAAIPQSERTDQEPVSIEKLPAEQKRTIERAAMRIRRA